MDVFNIFTSAWKKTTKCAFEIYSLPCAKPIPLAWTDPRSSKCYANCFLGLTNGFLNKNFQVIKLFINHCSFITLAQNTILRLLPFLELKLKVLFLYMFHWINIHFLIHYLPIKNFAKYWCFSVTRALKTAETTLKKNCFQFFVYGFIFSLKTRAYLKCKRVLYSSDRLVVFSSPSLSLKKEKVKDWIIVIG